MTKKTKRARKDNRSNNNVTRRSRRVRHQIAKMDTNTEPESFGDNQKYYSTKMVFDGKTIFTESQKNDEPIKRRKYTLKQLEQEIPIGAELVKDYLDCKVPPSIEYPLPNDIEFKSVLPNPTDLGLMPPRSSIQTRTQRRRKIGNPLRNDTENLRLVIEDDGASRRHKRRRNLFDLP